MSRKTFATGFAWGVCCWLACAGACFGKAEWLKIENDEAIVYTDASRRSGTNFLLNYTAYRTVFKELLVEKGVKLPKAVFLCYSDEDDFAKIAGEAQEGRFTLMQSNLVVDEVPLAVLNQSRNPHEAFSSTCEFETVHTLGWLYGNLPTWITQGAGIVLSSVEYDKTSCTAGRDARDYERWSRRASLGEWEEFFKVNTSSPTYRDSSGLETFCGQAWMVMHRVMMVNPPEGRERFRKLVALGREVGSAEALARVLGMPEKQWTRSNLLGGKDHKRMIDFLFDEKKERDAVRISAAPEEEMQVWIAEVLTHRRMEVEAQTALDRAEQKAPQSPLLKEALARQARRKSDPLTAAKLYGEAVAADSPRSFPYLFSARHRLDSLGNGRMEEAGSGGVFAAESIAELRKLLKFDPENTEAHLLLARAIFLTPKLDAELIGTLEAGASLPACAVGVRHYRAYIWARFGDEARSQEDFRWLATAPGVPKSVAESARKRLKAAPAQQ